MSDLDLAAAQATNDVATRELVATLQALLQKRGDSLLSNRRMFLGLMRDYAPDKARAIRLLLAAFDFDGPRRMKAMTTLEASDIASEAQSLSSETGLREDLARWATGVWGEALRAARVAQAPPAPTLPIAPVRKVDDLTWSSPAAPAPVTAPVGKVDDLTWSSPVVPAAQTPQPAAPVPATPPPPAPTDKADDLTWSSPVAPAAQTPQPAAPAPVGNAEDLTWSSPVAPAAQTPAPASAAPPQTAPAGASPSSKRVSGQAWVVRFSAFVVAIVFIISIANRMGLFSDHKPDPEPQPVAEQPAQPPPGPPDVDPNNGTVVAKAADGTPIVLVSSSSNPNDWPHIPGAAHPGGDRLGWQFTTAIKFPGNQLFFYATRFEMSPNLNTGTATTFSSGAAQGAGVIATSKTVNAVRSFEKATGYYRLDATFSEWTTNAANAPPICLTLNVGQQANKFEPLVFCAAAFVNGACAPTWIGCGNFQ